jgi:hypothetical protein
LKYSSRPLLVAGALAYCLLGSSADADGTVDGTLDGSMKDTIDASGSWKDALGISGSLRAGYWSQDKNFTNNTGYSVDSAWLTLRPKEVEGFKLYLDGYVQEQDLARKEDAQSELREFYVEKSLGAFDFKVGRQITVWGRADRVNPTDNLSVSNLKLLMTDTEDQRLGVAAIQAVYNFGQYRLIGIYIPEWRSPTYPIGNSAGASVSNFSKSGFQNQFGIKLDNSGGAVDWSFSYFDGFSKIPDLSLASPSASGLNVGLNYNRIRVIGADFALNLGSYGFRGEAAYARTENSDGTNPLIQKPNLYAVIGGDRTFFETFNVNAQIMYRHAFGFHDAARTSDPNIRTVASIESIITNQQFEDQAGMTLRPSYKMFNETLEMEVAFVRWFGKGESLIRPKVTYAFTDKFKGIVGGEIYSGPPDSTFGLLKHASSAFAELRYNF